MNAIKPLANFSYIIITITTLVIRTQATVVEIGDLNVIQDPGNPSDGIRFLDMTFSDGKSLADAIAAARVSYPNARLATPDEWDDLFKAAGIVPNAPSISASSAFDTGAQNVISSGANYDGGTLGLQLGYTHPSFQLTVIWSDPDGELTDDTTRDYLILMDTMVESFQGDTLQSATGWLLVSEAQHVGAEMEFVTIGDPGNPPDEFAGGHGSVEYVYRIGKHEVTNAQYAAFLNEVDGLGNDPLDLHVGAMKIESDLARPFSQKYRPVPGWEEKPVTSTSVAQTQRFINWLNGGDTESGTYDINDGRDAPRNSRARFFLPNRDEWHKAAYYQGPNSSQFPIYMTDYALYPTGEWTINNDDPPGDSESANYGRQTLDAFNDVGSFFGAVGHYGTFDMGGNASELIEQTRQGFGGAYNNLENSLRANAGGGSGTDGGARERGFRVAAVAETQPDPLVPTLEICEAVELKWTSQVGVNYQVQHSSDMKSWIDDGAPISGTGSELSALRSKDSKRQYYRVRVLTP